MTAKKSMQRMNGKKNKVSNKNGSKSKGSTSKKGNEFAIGEKVVYASQGVGIIDDIKIREVAGQKLKFYQISIVESGLTVSVPVNVAESKGLRGIVDQEAVDEVYDILRDRDVRVDTQTWNRRFRQYQQQLKTGSVFEIAKVIRDLTVLRIDKELSFGEKDMLKTARVRLVKEISIAKALPEDLVNDELKRLCQIA